MRRKKEILGPWGDKRLQEWIVGETSEISITKKIKAHTRDEAAEKYEKMVYPIWKKILKVAELHESTGMEIRKDTNFLRDWAKNHPMLKKKGNGKR
jgi:hypothetical protein